MAARSLSAAYLGFVLECCGMAFSFVFINAKQDCQLHAGSGLIGTHTGTRCIITMVKLYGYGSESGPGDRLLSGQVILKLY
jgi:hypothetical protein